MKIKILQIVLVTLLSVLSSNSIGQVDSYGCGTPERDTTEFMQLPWIGNNDTLHWLLDSLDIDNALRSTNPVFLRIPIKAWVHRHSDGSGGMSLSDIRDWLIKTNELFDANNCGIQFYFLCDIGYIDDDDHLEINNYVEAQNISDGQWKQDGACNVHFVENANDANGFWMSSTDAVFISSFAHETTMSHEIGHYLGLDHTHQYSNPALFDNCFQEPVDHSRHFAFINFCGKHGLKCDKTGDGLCDTPADPDLQRDDETWVNSSCTYTGTFEDTYGDRYDDPPSGSESPDETNLMSYSRRDCRDHFSDSQRGVMLFTGMFLKSGNNLGGWGNSTYYSFDEYEPNNEFEIFSTITVGETQTHSFHWDYLGNYVSGFPPQTYMDNLKCDVDIVRFNNQFNAPIKLRVTSVPGKTKPEIRAKLFDANKNEIAVYYGSNTGDVLMDVSLGGDYLPIGFYYLEFYNQSDFPTEGSYGHYEITVEQCTDCCFNYGLQNETILDEPFNLGAWQSEWVDFISNSMTVSSTLYLNEYAQQYFGNSSYSIPNSHLTALLCNGHDLTILNGGTLKVGDDNTGNTADLIIQSGSKLRIKTGATLDISRNSKIIVHDGGELILEEGSSNNLNGSGNLAARVEVLEGGKLISEGGDLHLAGTNSCLLFDGGELHIAPNTTFEINQGNASTSGYVEFKGADDHELFTGTGSMFKLVGDGDDDVMLKMNSYADLWNANPGLGTIYLKDCKVDLTDHGRLWTDMKMQAFNVTFEDTQDVGTAEGGNVQVWWNNWCTMSGCKFNGVLLKNHYTYTNLSNAQFNGLQSGFESYFGSYAINGSAFNDSHVKSNSLYNLSQINNSTFDNAWLDDESVVELRITKTDFNASTVNKYGGKLSLKCNYFKGINNEAVSLSEGTLNMSSTSAAGYNTFENTGTCILLNNAQALDLYMGYNNLSGYSDCCICGTVNRSCKATCDLTQNALNNYWGAATNTFPPSPQPIGPLNPS